MGVSKTKLDKEPSLRATDIDNSLVVLPRKLFRNCSRRAETQARHCTQKKTELFRITVPILKSARSACLCFILRSCGSQTFSQRAPKRVESIVRHLQHASDIRRRGANEELCRLGGVLIAIAFSFKHSKRHQRVEEIARASRMQIQSRNQFGGA